jgi:hypothetical protein
LTLLLTQPRPQHEPTIEPAATAEAANARGFVLVETVFKTGADTSVAGEAVKKFLFWSGLVCLVLGWLSPMTILAAAALVWVFRD